MSDDDYVRFNVRMPEKLRDDAKRNTERGELAEETRSVFRRKAYGVGGTEKLSELEQVKAELREVRNNIDDLRHKRNQIDAEIQTEETRAARLEERVDKLEEQRDDLHSSLETLENMLQSGDRMWPTRIKNAADVDMDTAEELYHELRGRNDDLPEAAFEEPSLQEPADWRDANTTQ